MKTNILLFLAAVSAAAAHGATPTARELGERYPSGKMLLYEQSIEEYAGLAVDQLLAVLRGREVSRSRIVYRFKPVMKA